MRFRDKFGRPIIDEFSTATQQRFVVEAGNPELQGYDGREE